MKSTLSSGKVLLIMLYQLHFMCMSGIILCKRMSPHVGYISAKVEEKHAYAKSTIPPVSRKQRPCSPSTMTELGTQRTDNYYVAVVLMKFIVCLLLAG